MDKFNWLDSSSLCARGKPRGIHYMPWVKWWVGCGCSLLLVFTVHATPERGAIAFINYCSGCHQLHYLTWSRIQDDLHLPKNKQPDDIAFSSEDTQQWFGKRPPDLSLINRQRGSEWLKAYLQGFYPDHTQRFGMANRVLPGVMMPNILESAQQTLSPQAYAMLIDDLVDFLAYTAEPAILVRYHRGWIVVPVLMLCVVGLICYMRR